MADFSMQKATLTLPEAVLLDMDGTLVDHFEALYRCYKYVSEKLGKPGPSPEEVRRSVGGSMPVTIRKFFSADLIDQATTYWREHFDDIHLENVVVLDGARELLATLQKLEIKAAVFTNKIGRHTRNICEDQGFVPYLAEILGAEDTEYRKPQPELSKIILERLEAAASASIMIGDSPFDIESAHCVGMKAICVPTGTHTSEELKIAGADQVFSSLREINDSIFVPLLNSQSQL